MATTLCNTGQVAGRDSAVSEWGAGMVSASVPRMPPHPPPSGPAFYIIVKVYRAAGDSSQIVLPFLGLFLTWFRR
jgi:hypothetical protein